jgi:hypothetical protein
VGLEPTTYGLKVPRNPELLVYLLYKSRVTLCHEMPRRAITYRFGVIPRNDAVRVMPGADGPYRDGRAHTEHTRPTVVSSGAASAGRNARGKLC